MEQFLLDDGYFSLHLCLFIKNMAQPLKARLITKRTNTYMYMYIRIIEVLFPYHTVHPQLVSIQCLNVVKKLYKHHYGQFWNTVITALSSYFSLRWALLIHSQFRVTADCCHLWSPTVPVGMRAGTHPTGPTDGVSIVTFLAVLTVIPSSVVLTVLGTDEQDS